MAYTIEWLVEHHIIDISFSGVVTSEEFFQSDRDIEAFAKIGSSPLYLMIDTHNITEFPPSFREMLQDIRRINQTVKIDTTIIISNNTLLNFFGLLAAKMVDFPVRVYKTREDALKLVVRQSPDFASVLTPYAQPS